MDGGRRLNGSVKGWFGGLAESIALYRAGRAANRRAAPRFQIRRGIGSSLSVAFLMACGVSGLLFGGHYEAFKREHGSAGDVIARMLGFGVDHVLVSGTHELGETEVIQLAGVTGKNSLPLLDGRAIQQKLMDVPMIADATITKLYPNRLQIEVVERVPYALWQLDGVVNVISVDGTVIEPFRDARFLRLPHVVGKDANLHAQDYAALVLAAPDLSQRIKAGTLVAGRRWTLKLDNGVDLKLPEIGAAEALRAFAEVEKAAGISKRAVLGIDLRIPDRIVVRLTEEAAAQHAESVAQRIKKAGGRV